MWFRTKVGDAKVGNVSPHDYQDQQAVNHSPVGRSDAEFVREEQSGSPVTSPPTVTPTPSLAFTAQLTLLLRVPRSGVSTAHEFSGECVDVPWCVCVEGGDATMPQP